MLAALSLLLKLKHTLLFPELREQLKEKVEEHTRDRAEIEGKFSSRMCMRLREERKKKMKLQMNVISLLALQNQLSQTEAQCSRFEQKLQGECNLC